METKKKVIVLLGDSLFAYYDGWENLDPEAQVLNFGRGGDNTFLVLRRVREACAPKPNLIFLEVGINDLLQKHSPVDLSGRHAILWRTISALVPEARLVVCSLLPINESKLITPTPSISENILDVNERLSVIAKTFRVEYIDFFPLLAGPDKVLPADFTDDGVHLTAVGYEAWFKSLRPYLTKTALLD
jgi:lysophospholipase L1-like esterase